MPTCLQRSNIARQASCVLPAADAPSPALVQMGDYLAVSVREALLAHPDPDAVLRYSDLAPYDTAVVEACLAALPVHHPVAPLLKGKLAAAR